MAYSETVYERILQEIVQRGEEGCDVQGVRAEIAALEELPDRERELASNELYKRVMDLNIRSDFAYQEPSTLEEIRKRCPAGDREAAAPSSSNCGQLRDRLLGAWLGRIAGCMLGKPVEGLMGHGRQALVSYLREMRAWPLEDYVPWREKPPLDGYDLKWWRMTRCCCRGEIVRGERDDDTDYTLLGIHILERYGPDFTADDVAMTWLSRLPFHQVFTAERVAYRNLVENRPPPESAVYRNPYRNGLERRSARTASGMRVPAIPGARRSSRSGTPRFLM